MSNPTDTDIWAIDPNVIAEAIKYLVGAWIASISLIGGALVGVILYVWHQHKNTTEANFTLFRDELKELSSSLRDEIGKVANNLEGITKLIFDRQNELAGKVTEIDTRCYERHEREERNMYRRKGDIQSDC